MNSVNLIGRLTRDPEIRYNENGFASGYFTLAIDRPPKKDGTKETDFPRVRVIGLLAQSVEKNLRKGSLVGVNGSVQTGSYTDKNGVKVYTTDVFARNVEFLADWGQVDWNKNTQGREQTKTYEQTQMGGFVPPDPEDFPY